MPEPSGELLSALPSLFALGLAALAALSLVLTRWPPPDREAERRAAARALAVAIAVQSVHFAEEAANGLHARLGPQLGLPGMPYSFFIGFNLAWLAIWVASVPGLRSARSAAFFAAWFLAVAGMLNGLAHPLLSVAAGGYFPGLLTSPLIGGAGLWLWVRLRHATAARESRS